MEPHLNQCNHHRPGDEVQRAAVNDPGQAVVAALLIHGRTVLQLSGRLHQRGGEQVAAGERHLDGAVAAIQDPCPVAGALVSAAVQLKARNVRVVFNCTLNYYVISVLEN